MFLLQVFHRFGQLTVQIRKFVTSAMHENLEGCGTGHKLKKTLSDQNAEIHWAFKVKKQARLISGETKAHDGSTSR